MLRFGTAIARLRAHQLDAYEGRACKEANLARGRQPVPIVDVDRCLHEKAFIAWFMAEEIQGARKSTAVRASAASAFAKTLR